MSLEIQPEVTGLPLVLPPHLTENFEKAREQIIEYYGVSPDVPSLVRLWVACGTSWRIRQEFERAVLDIQRKSIKAPHEEIFDEDDI